MTTGSNLPAAKRRTVARALPWLLLLALISSSCAMVAGALDAKAVAAEAAVAIYGRLDAGDLAGIYRNADVSLQKTAGADIFIKTFDFVPELGKRIKSQATGFKSSPLDDGTFQVDLTYDTRWANFETRDVLTFIVSSVKGAPALLAGLQITSKDSVQLDQDTDKLADAFYTRLAAHQYSAIYADADASLKSRETATAFATRMSQVESLGAIKSHTRVQYSSGGTDSIQVAARYNVHWEKGDSSDDLTFVQTGKEKPRLSSIKLTPVR